MSINEDVVNNISAVPKVSIIIPLYNCENFIRETIESVVTQTYHHLEIIVVDDGSTDRGPEIVRTLAASDPRINLISQANSGRPGTTRNRGLECATGEYVSYLDSDDRWNRHRVEHCVQALHEHPESAAIFHDLYFINTNGAQLSGSFLKNVNFETRSEKHLEEIAPKLFRLRKTYLTFMSLNYCGISTDSIMIRRNLVLQHGLFFLEDVSCGEDIDVWFRLVADHDVLYLNEILGDYRQHDESITKNKILFFSDAAQVHIRNLKRFGSRFDTADSIAYREKIAGHFTTLAYLWLEKGRSKEARKAYRDAFHYGKLCEPIIGYCKSFFPLILRRKLRNLRATTSLTNTSSRKA